ncbi:Hypothetical protein CINCED_3A019739 [Cinara cedri]|uniref:DDE Tnp4 domain-containing protein n=1 Tax=Cinara cedri TaxID=506608 RepID=A0A5E4N357_9HEMI|nr:Hypothetical protein CINCED_3A019739 [Cinara cedri]
MSLHVGLSCQKQTIFKKSCIYNKLVSGYWKNSLIVADNEDKNVYLNLVERSYGVLKRRFPVLSSGSRLKIDITQAMIVACCVLHNVACNHNDLEPPKLLGIRMPGNDDLNLRKKHEPEEGNARLQLTEEYFSLYFNHIVSANNNDFDQYS